MKLTIDTLGAQGDGIARIDGRAVFVPFSLPGEIVEAEGEPPHLSLTKIVSKSSQRAQPPCPHFRSCGGCSLQHASAATMLEWKRRKVVDCFASEGMAPEIDECIGSAPASRRRVTFTATRGDNGVTLGFKARQSDELIGIGQCPILVAEIADNLEIFAKL